MELPNAAGLVIINSKLPEMAGSVNVAVGGGRILAVGGDEVLSLVDPGTRVIDAEGGAVLPGINDGHLHFIASAMAKFGYFNVGATAASSWLQVAALLRGASPGADGWIRAHGWDEVVLGPGGADVLRGLRPDTPVVVFDQTGHQLLANQAAMTAAGIGRSPAVPAGGVIGRTASGEPSGLFVDAAMEMITEALPPVPRQDLRAAALNFQRLLHAQGITSLTEPGLGPGGKALIGGACTTDALELLGDLAAGGELTVRINTLLLFAGTGGVSAEAVGAGLASGLQHLYADRGIDPRLLRIAGVKVFADGTPRSGTAWMSEPYGGECNHGSLVVAGASDAERVAELHEIIRLIHGAGLQAGIHATGDAATESAVDAIIAAQADGPAGRHYIIHGAFRSNESLARLAANQIGYSTNPAIRAAAGDLLKRLLGEERYGRHQPLLSALRAGVKLNIASDSPVTDTDWRRTVAAAVTRDTVHEPGRPDDPERISTTQALLAMTALPAWQDHAETFKGRLVPGMAADLCVLDGAWPDTDIDELAERKVAWTIAAGSIVHEPGWAAAGRGRS
ncbi:amidohydrolase [Arthrobacter sp. I2-34]|uniref:Amidohydrolase n=1 Tax=Arthrobacter hankyongi TaxID=2904801 RepID=A0ABS9L3W0_9MICC|nr:amidohydrolase [Arthrobacter hankyongi]MCG2621376.1 amidohydrolase [Arthrobacter hankyongi]